MNFVATIEMYAFNTTIHARPPEATIGPTFRRGRLGFPTLEIPHVALAHSFSISFEVAEARLTGMERLFCEADGSFVWASPHDGPAWQVDGNLFDRNGRLLFVDLKGTCPAEEFGRLLTAFGWPETAVVFQLVREAIFLDEAEFRRWASVGESSESGRTR